MKNKIIFPTIFLVILVGVMILSNLSGVNSSNSDTESLNPTAVEQKIFMYLSLKGSKQGAIQGSVTTAGLEGMIEVYSYTHSIISPVDAGTGQPSGKRQHKPLTITKPLDKSTPLLYQSLVTSETLSTWELDFYHTTSAGKSELYYTIELTNARISEITSRGSGYGVTESVSFVYQKITWTWVDGGITAQDDWASPVA